MGRPHETAEPVPEEEGIAAGTIPGAITREPFDPARAPLAANQTFSRRNTTAARHLLRASVSGGQCGLACPARRARPGNRYYVCTGKYLQVRRRTGATCTSRFLPAAQVGGRVWQDLCDWVRPPRSWPRPYAGPPGDIGCPRSGNHGATAAAAGEPVWRSNWSA
jgi:hypothetical protein